MLMVMFVVVGMKMVMMTMRITAMISMMMEMAPSSDWIWLRSVLIRIIKWKFAWHRARLDLDSLESDMDALVRMRVFPTKKTKYL